MSSPAAWNEAQFGCILRDSASVASLMRTALSGSLPVPVVSRKADTSAPLEMSFGLEVSEAGWRAWQQWVTYDLADGSLPFYFFLPWGTVQPRVRARLIGSYQAVRIGGARWAISGVMQIERESLPRFSGGALA
jgi:hypothetical protein